MVCRFPYRPRTASPPVNAPAAGCWSIIANSASNAEMSTWVPCPVLPRWCSAAPIAASACTAELTSASAVPKCIGGPPSAPVSDMSPE